MKLYIRAHDLGVQGAEAVANRVEELGLDGVQLVAYKCYPEVQYLPGSINKEKAKAIADSLHKRGKDIVLTGAYFNPVHSNLEKRATCKQIFKDYLSVTPELGCPYVGSETGSYNDDKWTYHPLNHSDEALDIVVDTFRELCDEAKKYNAVVAIEGAYGHVCYDPKRLQLARERINRDNLKVIFDLYNYLDISNLDYRWQILSDALMSFGSDIIAIHVKDCIIEDDHLKQVGVGKGLFDYEYFLYMIRRVLPNANLVLEGTTGDDIEPAVQHLKKFME